MGSFHPEPLTEPIAIVGLSCRFASSASSPEELWKMLAKGKSGWSEIPASRFHLQGAFHPDPNRSSGTNVRGGHFLEQDLGVFDAPFFHFTAEAASSMDPQFRLQLETVYEALENAGLQLNEVAGTDASVFSAVFVNDYKDSFLRDEDNLPRLLLPGNGAAMASNRISHFFDFRGPSFTVDTGCSGSLVALHQAVQSLRSQESNMAVVSGTNLLLNPDQFKSLSSLGLLSPDGKSFAFDSRANGYGRGEGVATVIIKRLKDAVAAGDPVRGIIRETFLNQDGRTETITTPSQAAQEALIRGCYQKAGLDPLNTQYCEAHGTGTPTGDIIEARAMANALRSGMPSDPVLRIGSVKTNVGHTEAASGLAGIIKVVLAMEQERIPPSINFEKSNPKLSLEKWRLQVVRALEEWPIGQSGVRRASINNFGYGGTNAHVIMQDAKSQMMECYPNLRSQSVPAPAPPLQVLILSAHDEHSCQQMVTNLKAYLQRQQLEKADELFLLQRLIYTLGNRRSRHSWVACHPVPCNGGISAVNRILDSPQFRSSRSMHQPRIGMVFTGQGAQWYAMGRELIPVYAVFRSTLEKADRYLQELGANWSLLEELSRDNHNTRVNETALSIPICVAVQIALVQLLQAWGLYPTAVTSHSSGEIAAAYTAGALDLSSSMAVAYYRCLFADDRRLFGSTPGAMTAVGRGIEEVERYLTSAIGTGAHTAVPACINSPSSVTVAGDVDVVERVETIAKEDGAFCRRLKINTAYHSHHMKPVAEPYRQALLKALPKGKTGTPPPHPIECFSPVTGGQILSGRMATVDHWIQSLLGPVEFVNAVSNMVLDMTDLSSRVDLLLEVGPHKALGGPLQEILSLPKFNDVQVSYHGCLVRHTNAVETMQALAAQLISQGYPVNLNAVNFPADRPRYLPVLQDLPSYPWNHAVKHWSEPRFNRSLRKRTEAPHELLGSRMLGSDCDSPAWRHTLRVSDSPWLEDHVVQSNVLYPGAGYACLAIEAMSQLAQHQGQKVSSYHLRHIDILQALIVPDVAEGTEIQTALQTPSRRDIGSQGWMQFEVRSVTSNNRWMTHARGEIRVDNMVSEKIDLSCQPATNPLGAYTRDVDPEDFYRSLHDVGICHGSKFRNIQCITQAGNQARSVSDIMIGKISTIETCMPQGNVVHPTIMDSVVQTAYTALSSAHHLRGNACVPRRIDRLWVSAGIPSRTGHVFRAHTCLSHADKRGIKADIILVNAIESEDQSRGEMLRMEGLDCQSIGQTVALPGHTPKKTVDELQSKISWAPDLGLILPTTEEALQLQLVHTENPEERSLLIGLRRACVYYMKNAVDSISESDRSTLRGHWAHFFSWMQEQIHLAESGLLGPGSAAWVQHRLDDQKGWLDQVSQVSVNGSMLCHVGPHLAALLRGETKMANLMDDQRRWTEYHAHAIKMQRCFTQLSELLRSLLHKKPRAHILEIGAGSGGATRHALQAMGTTVGRRPLTTTYQITDVSPDWIDFLQDSLGDLGDMVSFETLDIELDPVLQGFESGTFDIVIASDMMHATTSVEKVLGNVHQLLKPDGTFLLLETTQDQLDVQLVCGLCAEWWLNDDSDGKETFSSPTRSTSQWNALFRSTGFSGVDLEIRDCGSEDLYSRSTMLTTVAPLRRPSLAVEPILLVTHNQLNQIPPAWLTSLRTSLIQAGAAPPLVQTLQGSDPNMYDGKICVFVGELTQPVLHDMDANVLAALQAMTARCKGLLWVTIGGAVDCENVNVSLAPGLTRVLRNEFIDRPFLTLDLDPSKPCLSEAGIHSIVLVLQSHFDHSVPPSVFSASESDAVLQEFEYAERNGLLLIPRCFPYAYQQRELRREIPDPLNLSFELFHQPDRPIRMELGVPGLIDSLQFVEDTKPKGDWQFNPDCIEIAPRAFGVNFRDVLVAMGQLDENVMGIECAGLITRVGSEAATHGYQIGDSVFAILRGPFSSRVCIEWTCVVQLPPGLNFEVAASIPTIFITAYLALYDIARLQRGQSVLIHAAAGGVGQAAIQLAQLRGAEIFVTVGTAQKRSLLVDQYQIPADHIFSSRDISFAAGVRAATNGRGVDVVLNSLTGSLLDASFDLLAPMGCFCEIGKRDLEDNNLLAMQPFARHATFAAIDLLAYSRHRSHDTQRIMAEVSSLFRHKKIKPIQPLTVYSMADAVKAFRLLQTGKHQGKVVLSTSPEERVPILQRLPVAKLCSDASYLLVGGLGGIGLSVAHWLIAHGGRNLILLSRSAATPAHDSTVKELRNSEGCTIKTIGCDIADPEQVRIALRDCEQDPELPPIRGIIHTAMVLRDSIFEQMTIEDFHAALRPKVQGTWNLNQYFQQPGQLDFFIMFSSVVGVTGNASQANYAAAGAYQDALARWRVSNGLPGTAIDLGPVKGVGHLSQARGLASRFSRMGYTLISEDQVLDALKAAILSPLEPQIVVGINPEPGPQWSRDGQSVLGRDARFQALQWDPQQGKSGAYQGGRDGASLADQLAMSTSRNEAERLVGNIITRKLADIFMIDAADIDMSTPPTQLGVDSLVAVEIRNLLALQAGTEIPIFIILQSPSLAALAAEIVDKSSHLGLAAVS
ncbi:polyketide synthase [Penicillium pulvis]|uniref:polyketide synthase n=1 Tax=Penicillium pulvis TaxID=1562058 RepID=UPI0025473802|nr:polyketide synthase [Penicillium pulvis]KAJ5792453.1 polyketide synthase [Penicillium pulvis]